MAFKAPFTHPEVSEEDKAQFLKEKIAVTDEQIEECLQCEQRTERWHGWRANRLTGTRVGPAVGMSSFSETPRSLCKGLIWPTSLETNDAMRHGTFMEPWVTRLVEIEATIQARLYLNSLEGKSVAKGFPSMTPLYDVNISSVPEGQVATSYSFKPFHDGQLEDAYWQDHPENVFMRHTGLLICKEFPWIAASTDGIHGRFYNETKVRYRGDTFESLPSQYYCQIQAGMFIWKMKEAVVTVLERGRAIETRYYPFDTQFWDETLFPQVTRLLHEPVSSESCAQGEGYLEGGPAGSRTEAEPL